MAQLLVRLRDRTHPDPEVSARQYKQGDVIDVFEDGKLTMPQPVEHWAVLQITGLSVTRAKEFLLGSDMESVLIDGVPQWTLARRRLRGFGWSDLPAAVRNALASQRYYTTNLASIRNSVRNRRTGAIETL